MTMRTFLVGMLIAGAVGVAQVLVSFDPSTVGDPRVWLVGLVGAFIRPAAVFMVTKLVTR